MSDRFLIRPAAAIIQQISILLASFMLGPFVLTCVPELLVESVTSHAEIGPPLIVGYLSEGRMNRQTIKSLDQNGTAKRLTHILYAFGQVKDGGVVLENEQKALRERFNASESVDGEPDAASDNHVLRGTLNQLRKLKLRHPRLKLLLSIGGDAANARGFSEATRDRQSIARFVQVAIDHFITGNIADGISAPRLFDGFDIDWEYPTDCWINRANGCVPQDKENFTTLLAEFRRQLDDQGKRDGLHYELTMAGSAWPDDYEKYQWQSIHPLLDFINVMTYWEVPLPAHTRPISPLYKSANETGQLAETINTDYAVIRYLKEGVPANKIVIGVPFYGLGREGVPDLNNGLFQKPAKFAPGTWGNGYEPYRNLKKLSGFRAYRDPAMQSPWLFDPTKGVFWSFDDPRSLAAKMDYVKQHALRGVMFWELSGDDENGSLVKALYESSRR